MLAKALGIHGCLACSLFLKLGMSRGSSDIAVCAEWTRRGPALFQIRDLAIRWKLLTITILIVAIAELFSAAAVTVYNITQNRVEEIQDIIENATVLADGLVGALRAGNGATLRSHLASLASKTDVAAAGVYNAQGALLAAYIRSGIASELPQTIGLTDIARIEGNKVVVSRPVIGPEGVVGRVYIAAVTVSVGTLLVRIGGLMLLAAIGAILIAIPISMRLNTISPKSPVVVTPQLLSTLLAIRPYCSTA